jgi:hypothetical protein
MKAAFFLFPAVAYSIAIFATAAAQELNQTFVAPEGYIIKLPPGWIEAGKDELAALEKLVLEGAPNAKLGAPRNQVVHLYRQDTDTNLFGDPRIMVAFCRAGKLPETVIKASVSASNCASVKPPWKICARVTPARCKTKEPMTDFTGQLVAR